MKRYFVKLSYDGTDYAGWQIQPNAHTVQAELQTKLTKLNSGVPVKIMGCGRTDTGVHAIDFFMHMDYPDIKDMTTFIFKLNTMLPDDIVIHGIYEVSSEAHTRFDAISRTYHYKIHTVKSPFGRFFSLQFNAGLDINEMNRAAGLLLKYNDFEAFSKVKTAVNTFICHITEARWEVTDEGYVFIISADRFLRNMVRAIVGTLLEVGQGKMTVKDFENIILSKQRSMAGKSAPAHGLCLTKVQYPYDLKQ